MYDRVDRLRQLLNKWDSIGVFNPYTNTDEYDCMIAPLLTKLAAGTDAEGIKGCLDAEITGHSDFGMSRCQVGTASMAERLVAWEADDRGGQMSTGRSGEAGEPS